MIFNANSIWNKPIGASPVRLTQYDAFYAAWTPARLALFYRIPIYNFDALTTPRRTVDGAPTSNAPQPPTLLLPVPDNAFCNPESDGNLILLDRTNGLCLSYYKWSPDGDGTYKMGGGWFGDTGELGNGLRSAWGPAGSYVGRRWDGNRATRHSYLAGLVLLSEVQSGVINHAMAISIDVSCIQATPNYVWPSFESDGGSTNPNHPKMGMRVQLDPALNLDTVIWNGQPLNAAAKVVAKALQTYGAWVCDSGSAGHHGIHIEAFYSSQGVRDDSPWAAIGINDNSIMGIPIPSLRIVQALSGDFYTAQIVPVLPPLPPAPLPVPVPSGPLVIGDWATNLPGTLFPMKVIAVGSTKIRVLAVSGAILIRRELTKALYKRATPNAGQIATWQAVLHGLWPEIV